MHLSRMCNMGGHFVALKKWPEGDNNPFRAIPAVRNFLDSYEDQLNVPLINIGIGLELDERLSPL